MLAASPGNCIYCEAGTSARLVAFFAKVRGRRFSGLTMSSFFNELKRRNVVRVGVMYLVFCWVLIQLSDIIFPMFSIPEWGGRLDRRQ